MKNKKNSKINYDTMKCLFDQQLQTFVNKNHDYGNSFEQSLEKHGLTAGIVRMEDKMNRLSFLVSSDTDPKVLSESLPDTLMDLANYATMAAAWLKNNESTFEYDLPQKGTSVKELMGSIDYVETEWLTINNNSDRVLVIYPRYEDVNKRRTQQPFVYFRVKAGQWYLLLVDETVMEVVGYCNDEDNIYTSFILYDYDRPALADYIKAVLEGDEYSGSLLRLSSTDIDELMCYNLQRMI